MVWEAQPIRHLKLKGLGPKSKQKLIEAGIHTVEELLCCLPRAYLDYSRITPIPRAPLDEPVHIRGLVLSRQVSLTHHKRLPVLEILVDDGEGTMRAVWFNQAYVHDKIAKGQTLALCGKVKLDRLGRHMNSPKFVVVETNSPPELEIEPVYRQMGGLSSEQIKTWIGRLLSAMPEEEKLPSKLAQRLGFPTRKQALTTMHQPGSPEVLEGIRARREPAWDRLVFEEFYHFQQRLAGLSRTIQTRNHPRIDWDPGALDAFYSILPFELTRDQQRVIRALSQDLADAVRLHALIQGDVGCGKTVIGLAFAYVFKRAGYQSVLLCPTTVLANQHLRTATELLAGLGVRTLGLYASLGASEMATRLRAVAEGKADLIIGTHKLLQKDVRFARLGLVLIDEQHRFGVEQRRALLKKARAPHYLAFSATPIPRSLALTVYGDFKILQIHEKPAGRVSIRTILKKSENRSEIIAFAKSRMARGESVFWVFPLIEGREDQQESSADHMYKSFCEDLFRNFPVGLVHGKLHKEEVASTMAAFKQGKLRLLVATTVIEVGVDVPTASVMVVENADCFGLSQIHQLRGRVGRGDRQAFCFLVLDTPLSATGLRRMKILETTQDGFKIAEQDLIQRGAGELLGKRQSGMEAFRFGDPWRDRRLMEEAREYAFKPSETI